MLQPRIVAIERLGLLASPSMVKVWTTNPIGQQPSPDSGAPLTVLNCVSAVRVLVRKYATGALIYLSFTLSRKRSTGRGFHFYTSTSPHHHTWLGQFRL